MKKIKYALLLLPVFALVSCGKDEVHVSRPKEVIYKDYDGDSVYTEKRTFSYDKKGNVLTQSSYVYNDDTKEFVQRGKSVFEYDSKGNNTSIVNYDYEDGAEKVHNKITFTYSDNKLVKEEFYDINDSGDLYVMEYYGDYTYDSKNRLTGYNEYMYFKDSQQFEKSVENTYTYKGDIEEFEKMVSKNVMGTPDSDVVIERTFDDKGRIIKDKGTIGSYCMADLYTYTEDGMVSSNGTYKVNVETGLYSILSVYEYVYTKSFYTIEESHMFFDIYTNPGTIDGFSYIEYEYDSKMNVTSKKEYRLNMESNEYALDSEEIYSY